ncbi:MAG: diaminobutyrate acetyltransferase [Rhodocyclaceae bacterium]|nr:diaminobutyrate acetyltransferase [Rhodocyclaceae bacterium]
MMNATIPAQGLRVAALAADAPKLRLGLPASGDGAQIHALVGRCPPLDLNSPYAYLLLCHHFADTCVVALRGERVVGFIAAYCPPGNPAVVFVWQVAVDAPERGHSLGNAMLAELLARPVLAQVDTLETTVTPSNLASRRMFLNFAAAQQAGVAEQSLFAASDFGAAAHEEEILLRIEGLRAAANLSCPSPRAAIRGE